MRSRKILIVATDFKPKEGGIAEYIHNKARFLQLQGENIAVLAPHMKNDKQFDKKCGYNVIRYPLKHLNLHNIKTPFNTKKLLLKLYISSRKFNPDCLFLPHYMEISHLCMIISIILKIPYFTTAHGLEVSTNRGNLLNKLNRKIFFKYASKVFCVSSFTQGKVVKLGVKPEKTITIPNGIDNKKFKPINSSEIKERHNLKNRKVILTIARLIRRKGIDKVIESMPKVLDKIPNTVYLIGGTGPLENELKNLTRKYNLQDKVVFLGHIPEREKTRYYNACDVFIMPSRELKNGDTEGFGLVFLEANACGKPVVGGRSGGVIDAIIKDKTGLLINPLDTDEIAKAICSLLMNKKSSRKLGSIGKQRTQKKLNWSSITFKMRKEIENSLNL